jgi:FimV-like protein
MIWLIIQSYLSILLSVGIGCLLILFTGLYFIFRKPTAAKKQLSKQSLRLVASPDSATEIPASSASIESSELSDNVCDLGKLSKKTLNASLTIDDVSAIAGDDVLTTQLDLARAFIETGRKPSAQKILIQVLEQGSLEQQQEAQQLMNHI